MRFAATPNFFIFAPMDLPAAFINRMQGQLGTAWPEFLAALQSEPPASIRLHPLKKNLELLPVADPVPWHPQGRYLIKRPVFTLDPAFHAGAYYVQEASSMAIFHVLQQLHFDVDRIRALDLCAAPGGKSTLLAEALGAEGLLLANEVIRSRYAILQQNTYKWAIPNTCLSNQDSKDLEGLKGFFDLILVDAPCSGEGLFRKDPEARREWSPERVQLCAQRQRRILHAVHSLLRPGGYLLYSTCTYAEAENEDQVRWLIKDYGLQHVPIDFPVQWGVVATRWGHRFYPHRLRGEGLFLACLQKTTGSATPIPAKKLYLPQGLTLIPQEQSNPIRRWVYEADQFQFIAHAKGTVYAVPKIVMRDQQWIGQHLRRFTPGWPIGKLVQRQNFVPAPELALAAARSETIRTIELNRQKALQYLRKENPGITSIPKGWALVTYHNLGLGWIKGLTNRYNNYYPKNWRIRMQLPQ